MRARGIDILAIYHSHPTSEPVPSRKDRERNYSPDVMNFIISLASNEPQVRAWWLTSDDHREAEWELAGEDPPQSEEAPP
jgi:proteasome lid subunit RPN8/RPN11